MASEAVIASISRAALATNIDIDRTSSPRAKRKVWTRELIRTSIIIVLCIWGAQTFIVHFGIVRQVHVLRGRVRIQELLL